MPQAGEKDGRGEMRRRHEAIIRSGALSRLRSEGRLVFALALCWADYRTCQFRVSVRGMAKTAGVNVTSVRRGLSQLLDLGVIEAGPPDDSNRPRYRFRTPQIGAHEPCPGGSHSVSPPGHEPCAQRAHPVSEARTSGVQGAHTPCPKRAQPVSTIPQYSSRTPQESLRGQASLEVGQPPHEEPTNRKPA